jgi:3-oxoacyl-[acyl-carrier protein] reductase
MKKMTVDDFDFVIDVHLKGSWLGTRAAAKEVGFAGVRVNAIQPGLIESTMLSAMPAEVQEARKKEIPLGRFGTPEEVVNVALFLASDLSSYMTGNVVEIAGGRHI